MVCNYFLEFGGGGGMEYEEFTDLFFGMFNKKWDKLTCPILTRQYTVGLGATGVLKQWDELSVISRKISDSHNADLAPNKCASALTSMLQEPVLEAHTAWIYGYHKSWWDEHFLWLQSIDELTKLAGFRSQHMAERYFVMSQSLDTISETWSTNEFFVEYKQAKTHVTDPTELVNLSKIEREFFRIARHSLKNISVNGSDQPCYLLW